MEIATTTAGTGVKNQGTDGTGDNNNGWAYGQGER